MSVFNWIQTGFVDGPNFVSDAPDEIVQAIALALPAQRGPLARCDVGSIRIRTGKGRYACVFIRFTASAAVSTDYIHAVVSASGATEPTLSAVERLFHDRYGDPPETRLLELVDQLSQRSVAEATLSMTDLFVASQDLDRALGAGKSNRRSNAPRRTASSMLPWLVATAAVGFAAFVVGRGPYSLDVPPVSASRASLDLAKRIERLEGDRGAAGMSLRAQLEYERREHLRTLREKEEELRDLVARLDRVSGPDESLVESDVVEPRQVAETARIERPGQPPIQPPTVSAPPPMREKPRHEKSMRVEPSSVPARRAVVLADLLWVRGGPGTEYTRIWSLDGGTPVGLAGGVEAGWVEISSPEPGWVASEFLEFLGAPPAGAEGAVTPTSQPTARPEASDSDSDSGSVVMMPLE